LRRDSWRGTPAEVSCRALDRAAPEEQTETDMSKRRRNYKLKWRSKKANHGRKPCRGRDRQMS